ncbi:hypothetical protein [Streptomyces purpureus]|uniref:Uncharacterized protein n=1 Tax=Streptomyces purpureus TaxID=1951 RepID=A0A918LXZ2_9ACTN|nr:hypothetical protein [Streptomyces purpureus]GGT65915.1 hypothetical protein GCM10014713_68390 [Streptomyces purpureus]
MTNPDLAASQQALAQITKGINGTLAELKELGMVGEAGMGRGFSDLQLSGMESGHDGLTSALKTYCERWEWGVRSLVQKGTLFAELTGLSAGTFHDQEQYISGAFKVLTNSAMGNPYATEEEITQKSWGDVLSSNPVTHVMNADYSDKSFDTARENSKQAWKDTAWDVSTSKMVLTNGIIDAAGMRDEMDQGMREAFGPSPEERAKAAEQQGAGQG